ncbi:MAG: leucine--tRNA ligase [Mycoplasmoidaceae bacterium]
MYNHNLIEKNIAKFWKDNDIYHFDPKAKGTKCYILDMFPYPSGQGLHVGHPKGYTATDIYSRYKRFNGFNVLHPIGWDAFGLPAEQYALQTGNHPADFTKKNIEVFRTQLQSLGFSFDYNKEVNTTDPAYYKWTQWIFSKLFEKGLAEIKDVDVNWCEELGTVLSNEEVLIENGKMVSERGSYPVVKKPMRQWVLKITKYADKLLEGLDDLDWPENLKTIQRTWIGKSIGTNIKFKANDLSLEVFTTRPDTIYGVTFIAIAPENKFVAKLTTKENTKAVSQYIETAKAKTLLQRQEGKEKTGVFTGSYAINPINNKKVPIFVADYVLNDYANGIVMGVASADKRDYDFAKVHKLDIVPVIQGKEKCITTDGKHINSDMLDGLNIKQATDKINKFITDNKFGSTTVNYKLKDWIFSRQRYWGEPFPIYFDKSGKPHLIDQLPVKLPECKNFKPSKDGRSPLANLTDWLKVNGGTRDTNTMPQWAGSCWYYLAYLMKQDNGSYLALDSKEAKDLFKHWLPVDLYVGGQEHAVLHLLYARFWHRFLYDIGVVPTKEPFQKVVNQGMILGTNGEKMSKSRGNVINPNEIVKNLGADTLRLYEVFMGPLTATMPWSDEGLMGCRKWLDRVYNLFTSNKPFGKADDELTVAYHAFVKEATDAINDYKFNIAISKMMVYINACYKANTLCKDQLIGFLTVLSCFAPFVAEHLYQELTGKKTSITKDCTWPKYDAKYLVTKTYVLPVQINGKLRDTIEVNTNASQDEAVKLALASDKIKTQIGNKPIKKTIFVKGKILSFII